MSHYYKVTRPDGCSNRTQDRPIVVAMTLDRFLQLLEEATE